MIALYSNPRTYRWLWLLAMTFIVIGSLIPLSIPDEALVPGDKLQHIAAYALLGLLAMLAFSSLPLAAIAAVAMVGLGVAIEVVQYFLPWRQFEWLDMAANALGVALGMTMAAFARTRLLRST
ncbi:VanZ family protein [Aquisalimonas sp.]|uniref:VanZ family protein n=1 Tax=Aquisalimonas sp. TaxID=1872621 RepID=UPI0025BEADAD|nr:VanZ family protein [Aquisalimonas sp.]